MGYFIVSCSGRNPECSNGSDFMQTQFQARHCRFEGTQTLLGASVPAGTLAGLLGKTSWRSAGVGMSKSLEVVFGLRTIIQQFFVTSPGILRFSVGRGVQRLYPKRPLRDKGRSSEKHTHTQ
eukprot:1680506-Amphidinium_carterae.1